MAVKVTVKMTKAVERAVEKAIPQTLLEAGKYVWRIARASVKHRSNPNKSSAPGTPVHSHASGWNTGFKKTIVYGMEANKRSVVIGPMLVRRGFTKITKIHEFGGSKIIRDRDPKNIGEIHIGSEAPVTVAHVSSQKDTILRTDPHPDPRTGRAVVWIKIRTKSQAEHSERLYRRMSRKYPKYVMAHYPARPTMRPALMLATPKLQGFWRNAVKP